jgi:uncharacterized protein YcgI (DUF1989 family)
MSDTIEGLISRTRVPARFGASFKAARGQYIAVVDMEGGQTCDFWAFDAHDFEHYLSPPYVIMHIWSLQPTAGHELVTNRRDPILTIVHDDVGRHDLLCPACDENRYRLHFGVSGHRNCHDNFLEAMAEYDWGSRVIPNPFNVFMHTTVDPSGQVAIEEGLSKPGDMLILRAEMDIVGAASACPMDLTPAGRKGITDVEIVVGTDLEALKAARARWRR